MRKTKNYSTVSLEKIIKKQFDEQLPRGFSYNMLFKYLLNYEPDIFFDIITRFLNRNDKKWKNVFKA